MRAHAKKPSEADRAVILKMRADKYTITAIAKELGTSCHFIRSVVDPKYLESRANLKSLRYLSEKASLQGLRCHENDRATPWTPRTIRRIMPAPEKTMELAREFAAGRLPRSEFIAAMRYTGV